MSSSRSQALIKAPPGRIWELVGDPRRHPEWWPRVIEVRGESFEEGSNYAQVTRSTMGSVETVMRVERLEEVREIRMRCDEHRHLCALAADRGAGQHLRRRRVRHGPPGRLQQPGLRRDDGQALLPPLAEPVAGGARDGRRAVRGVLAGLA